MISLKEISAQLRSPFDPKLLDIREIKGGSFWVYAHWTVYWNHIQECDPDAQIDFEPAYEQVGYTIQKCIIIICGVRRCAYGSVESDPKGERGNRFERAMAESVRETALLFGVGAYLDDQERAIRELYKNIGYLNAEKKGRLTAYAKRLFVQLNNSVSYTHKPAVVAPVQPTLKLVNNEPQSQYNRSFLLEEIKSLMKRKTVSKEQAIAIAKQEVGHTTCETMTDEELVKFRDRLSIYTPQQQVIEKF